VGGAADVVQLDPQVVDEHVEPVGEGDEGRLELEVAPLDVGEDARPVRVPESEHVLPAPLVADHRRGAEHVVAVGVVAVVMGVDQGPHRAVGHAPHRLHEGAGPALRRAAVDGHHATVAGHEAGVVDPPAAVGLDEAEDAVGHLLNPGRREAAGVMIVVRGAHVRHRTAVDREKFPT
jgi:hypothetical protein